MTSAPAVSIVIPSYNHGRYLREAIESVVAQSVRDLEVIVIDDGSEDDSLALAREMALADDRIQVIEQENRGSHSALTRGMELAKGKWLTALNSDDRWHPQRIEVMLREATREDADLLFTDSRLIDEHGEPELDPNHWWNVMIGRYRDRVNTCGLRDGLLYGNLTVSTSNLMFTREVWRKIGPFRPYRYNLDWDFVLRCLMQSDLRIHFVREKLLDYRLHGKNTILAGMPVAALEALEISRGIQKRCLGVPEGMVLSQHRHERLLRRYFTSAANRVIASERAIIKDRERLHELLVARQGMVERERELIQREIQTLREDRDRLEKLLTARQQMIDWEREATTQKFRSLRDELAATADRARQALTLEQPAIQERDRLVQPDETPQGTYDRAWEAVTSSLQGLRASVDEIRAALIASQIAMLEQQQATARVITRLRSGLRLARTELGGKAWANGSRSSRFVRAWRALVEHSEGHSLEVDPGQVRDASLGYVDRTVAAYSRARVNVHLHVYYLDLLDELLDCVRHIRSVDKLVITGPWRDSDIRPHLEDLTVRCRKVVIDAIDNRGKDVGAFLHAVHSHGLLDCDYVLKLHSKRSKNPKSYFDAISQLFQVSIADGDQWRRAIIEPLAGSAQRVEEVIGFFERDPSVGMVGPKHFITTAPDVNMELYERVCRQLGAAPGLPFVAGTMFWARAEAMAALLESAPGLAEFDLDSKAVEGGLEHVFERAFGALVLSQGFDLIGV
jgi:O-antigen biosynthesis protein